MLDFPLDDRLNMNRYRTPRTRSEVTDLIGGLGEAGATGAIVHLPPGTSGLDECLEWVAWFAEEIIPAFKDEALNEGG